MYLPGTQSWCLLWVRNPVNCPSWLVSVGGGSELRALNAMFVWSELCRLLSHYTELLKQKGDDGLITTKFTIVVILGASPLQEDSVLPGKILQKASFYVKKEEDTSQLMEFPYSENRMHILLTVF